MSPSPSLLPIDSLRRPFSAALNDGPVVVTSPTGSGKSTQVPRWCDGQVAVIEPRRVACRSLAQRVAQLEGVKLGQQVGYHVRDERRASASTRILFVTPGMALRTFEAICRCQAVIVDEFHERGLEVDLLLALLQQHYAGHLVVMSATLDGERLAAHLGGQHLHAEGRVYPVAIEYFAKGTLLPERQGLEERVTAAVQRTSEAGDALIFLPGKAEIEACRRRLAGQSGLEVMALHGGLSLEQQSRVFDSNLRRKVVLATNVAETSLTVPGIGVVIDSGLVRQTRFHRDRGFLTLVPVAQDSAEQRTGRAGRTREGRAIRLWAEQAQLEARTSPEIFRESLVPLLLSAAACGANVDALSFVDAPKPHAIDAARQELQSLGALVVVDSSGGGNGGGNGGSSSDSITERGRRLFGLPIDAFLGRLLIEAEEQDADQPGLLDDMIDLVAMLAVGSRPSEPAESPAEEPHGSVPESLEARCDALASIRRLRTEGAPAEARAARKRLRAAFDRAGDLPPRSLAVDRQRLASAVLAADPRVAHVARQRGRRVGWSNGGTELELGRRSLVGDAEGVAAVAVLSTMALGLGRRDIRMLATCAMPLTFGWLHAAGLGRDRLKALKLQDNVVLAEIETVYAKKVIGERQEIPRGALARDAVTKLFLDGRLFKGSLQASRGNLEAAALARRLAQQPGAAYWLAEARELLNDEIPEFETWVRSRIAALGVESGEDVALLSEDDLTYPALPAHLLVELDRGHPREVKVEGITYRVSYVLNRNEVVLEAVAGKPKRPPQLFFLPRFAGFRIRVRHKGTLLTLRD